MKSIAAYHISIALALISKVATYTNSPQGHYLAKKNRCLNPPRTARRVETVIQECQEDVKNKLIREAYQMLKEEVYKGYQPLDANEDHMQFMTDVSDSAPHEAIGQVSGGSTVSAYSSSSNAGFELPSGYDTYEIDSSKRRVTRLLHHIRRIAHDSPTNIIYHPTLVPFEDKRIAGCLLHCVYAKNNAIDGFGWPTLDGLVDFYSEGVNEHGFFMATLRSVNLCLRAVTIKYQVNRRKLPERGESCDLAFDVFDCISDQITGYCLDQYK
ncbi:PREDICTED: uncharacterized protein LOC108365436 [Rhagoletis zephyria]|uniref:uncharacterized protein LOC108365436 n=1 Tax=Rhagoletis zephyria TaxID=28612 RepID=UPI0008116A22|nr:PREDICTED: uncharacterized protein LOC108365436 [Rhagoletis zephyria]